jgi:precorrin-6B methylase 2
VAEGGALLRRYTGLNPYRGFESLSLRQSFLAVLQLSLLLALAGQALAQPVANEPPQIGQVSRDSVWVPTPERVIRRMLQMADTTSADLVIDLGAGDGRIPIYAAKHFGARAIGVELEENLVRLARKTAAAQGVSHLATFVQQDLFETDLSGATVIALYISPGVMTRLRPRLAALRPGTRIVSHYFTLEDWEPDETIRVEGRTAHLWVVPAAVLGAWAVEIAGEAFTVRIDQRYQMLSTIGMRDEREVPVIGTQLRGTEIRFTSFDRDGSSRHFHGVVDGTRMSGESQGEGIAALRWSARRVMQ